MEQTRPQHPMQKPAATGTGGADNADLFRRPPVGLRLLGYRLLLQPRARLMLSWSYRWRVHGKRALRGFRRSGMFLYGNRTGTPLDALVPACLTDKPILIPAPRETLAAYAPLTRHCVGIPTPESHRELRPFLEKLEKHTVTRGAVAIYTDESTADAPYLYPVRFDEPSFVFHTAVGRGANGSRRAVTRVAGPFYPDMTLPHRLRAHELGERLRAAMRDLAAATEKEVPRRE